MSRAAARFRFVEETNQSLLIRDIGPWSQHPTVTNDAENVVAALSAILNDRRLFYFDSEGELGEIKVRTDGTFAGFAPASAVP